MLILLFYYMCITGTCLWTGFFAGLFLQHLQGYKEPSCKPVIFSLLWGLITITLAGQILALFLPVNQYTWLAWIVLLSAGTIPYKNRFIHYVNQLWNKLKQHTILIFPCCSILLMVVILSSGPLMMDDTESYHMQMIKWIQEYGSVPGLANLHERYGFNSSWFTFASFFIPTRTTANFYTVPNGLLSIWTGIYLLTNAVSIPEKKETGSSPAWGLASCVVFITALFCWPMLRGNATTGNYDFITTCMVLVLLSALCRPAGPAIHADSLLPELIVWPVFLCTVRVINFPLLLISLFPFLQLIRNKNYSLLSFFLFLSALLVVPFLARNVILSGYPFFPVYQVDLFPVDWKADINTTKKLVEYIKYYNRVNNAFQPISETKKLDFPGWIGVWFHYLFGYDKPVLILGLGGYVASLVQYKKVNSLFTSVRLLILAMTVQLISWFFIAPDPRFVYGPLLGGIFLLFLWLPFTQITLYYNRFNNIFLYLLSGCLVMYTITKAIRNPDYRHLIMPVAIPQPPIRLVTIDHLQLSIPEKMPGIWNPRCYATPLPCLYELQPGLTARGSTMREGFKIKR